MLLKIIFLFNFLFVFRSEMIHDYKFQISLTTSLGSVIGHRQQVQNKIINVFYGVPYAEKPIGKLRFRRTNLIEKFPEEPYYALNFKPHCVQHHAKKYDPSDEFSEDCLYMNIYTPDIKFKNNVCQNKYSIMLYIYGGTSSIYQKAPIENKTESAPLTYSGELFAALHDIIFVAFNFRQGILSSLYVEDEFHGNLALFDQNVAIRWVKKHIREFCGDDNKITLFGNSLGSNSIGLHLISDYSKKLISNAIMQSFSPLFRPFFPLKRDDAMISSLLIINELECLNLDGLNAADYLKSFKSTNIPKKISEFIDEKKFLNTKPFLVEVRRNWSKFFLKLKDEIDNLKKKKKNFDNDSLKLVQFLSKNRVNIECLQDLPVQKIADIKRAIDYNLGFFDFDFINAESYLNYKLLDKLSVDQKVNILIGSLSKEDCTTQLSLKEIYATDKFNAPAIGKNDAKNFIKQSLNFISDKRNFSDIVANYYTDETRWQLEEGYSQSISNFINDYEYYCPIYFYANAASFSNSNSVSAYIISQATTKHFSSFLFNYDLDEFNWMTPCHADELNLLFGLPIRIPNQFSDFDREFSLKLIELWTFFAKNGRMPNLNPSQKKWPISTNFDPIPRFVEINNKYTREYKFEFQKRCEEFWRPLLPFYQK